MQVEVQLGDFAQGFRGGECGKGVLPSFIARAFKHVLVLNTPLRNQDIEEYELSQLPCDSYKKRTEILLLTHRLFPEEEYGEKDIDSVIPIALDLNIYEGDALDPANKLLFLPPRMWTTNWEIKRDLKFYGDNTYEIALLGETSEDSPPNSAKKRRQAYM